MRRGETLTLTPGTATPDAVRSVQWLRAGRPVEGATSLSYRITDADLGHRLAARVQFRRDGYTTVTSRTPVAPRAKSVTRLDVEWTPGKDRLKVVGTATARGIEVVEGVLQVRSRGVVLGERPLDGGAATVRVENLSGHARNYHVVVRGTHSTTRAEEVRRLRIA